jgi:hypothetical protein
MIVERIVFRAKFGQGDAVVSAFKQWNEKFRGRHPGLDSRLLADLTGTMFTVVVENTYRDMEHLTQVQAAEQKEYGDPEWQQWFTSWSPHVETGSRELYQVVG